ncbi:hypothetical protein HMPREF9154_1961 [Arachnia propionica F0230a]|nr:hypothetical protein HMPREF9154_1961 [Arachnia propionica F0230a]
MPSRKDETLHECLFFECPRCRFHRTTWWDRVVWRHANTKTMRSLGVPRGNKLHKHRQTS